MATSAAEPKGVFDMSAAATKVKSFRLRIKRQDDRQSAPYWQEFELPYKPNLNVISCFQYIAANPGMTDGNEAKPVTYEAACLEEVCGSCTMVINGRVRQACSTLVDELLKETSGGSITIEPMTKFPVVRDLQVDRQRMFEGLKKIQGWVPLDGLHALGSGPRESPEDQETRYALSRCMTCGCCLEACPQFTIDNNFIGASNIGQTRYFNMHETGKRLKDERLEVMEGPGGISDCGNAQNCVKVCPKEIPLTEAIADVGRQTTIHSVKKFFTGKK